MEILQGRSPRKPSQLSLTVLSRVFTLPTHFNSSLARHELSTSQVAEAMASIGAYFSPDHIHDHMDANASNLVQFLQLQSALTELREVHS